jgi:O-antigen ligase
MYLLINIPFAVFFYHNAKNITIKLLMVSMVFLLFWGIYKTNSRGALVGLLSLIAVYGYFRYGKMKAILIGGISLPIVFIVMRMFRAIDSEEQSAGQRIEAWYTAIDLFKGHPFVGVGMGNFTEHHYLTAHNSYALVLAELGIFGYILWFIVTLFPLLKLFEIMQNRLKVGIKKQKLWSENFEQSKLISTALFYSMIGFLVTAFFISRSYSTVWMIIVSISMAHVFYVDNKFIDEADVKISNAVTTKKAIIMSFFSLIAFYIIVRFLM